MKKIGAITFSLVVLGAVGAQIRSPGVATVQSSSGQFLVVGVSPAGARSSLGGLSANINFISLEPTLLVVSCERIKQRLWDRLGATAPWRGRIYLKLHPARSADELVAVVAQRSPGGWEYLVSLPNVLPRDRFVRAIVQVLLCEIANRAGGARAADIPPWLVEGLCRELRAANEAELLLPPPTKNLRGLTVSPQVVDARWSSPGEQARNDFRSRPPLTFEQLSWPAEGQLAGEPGEVYGRSALLFVDALMRLPDGPACVRTMLAELPRCYNWQFAFLGAFQSHFQTALDVEKWWALQVVYLTGRGLFDRWTPAESLKKLDETLRARVGVRTGEDELPTRGEVDLQTVVREWDLAVQAQTLQRKLAELDLVRLRVTPDMALLVQDYRLAIEAYLGKRGLAGPVTARHSGGPPSDRVATEMIGRLNALDLRREALRRPTDAAPADAGKAPVR